MADVSTATGTATIRLAVPADEPWLRVLRVAAATAVADRTDMARLDDVRLAIDELAAAVIDAAPPGELLHVDLQVGPRTLSGRGHVRADGGDPMLSRVGELVVGTICRTYEVRYEGNAAAFSFTMELAPPPPAPT